MNRQGLTMPELPDLQYNSKSHSMTDMMLKTTLQQEPNFRQSWAQMPFSKSLSTSAIIKEVNVFDRISKAISHQLTKSSTKRWKVRSRLSMTAWTKSIVLKLIEIEQVLKKVEFEKYLQLFVDHEIDYKTFLGLEDADLKEMGIKPLGHRKKILACLKGISN